MKTLLIMRHGKSSGADTELRDHARPLKGRGRRNAKRMGEEILARDLVPDLIVSSTARRARSTARRAAEAAGCGDRIVESRELYMSSAEHQLRAVARYAGDEHERVMIVGHNPTLEDMVERLSGEDKRVTTANLACIDLDIESWRQLPAARGELRFLLRPKEL